MQQTILLGEYFEKFVSAEVSSGRYHSADEVIRTALRLLEEKEQKINSIRKALQAGEESELVEDFDAGHYLQQLHSKHS